MKKFLSGLCLTLLTIVSVAVLLFSAGTVITEIPLLGSVANIATVGFLNLWLPVCAGLFLISLILLIASRKKGLSGFLLLLATLSLVFTIIFTVGNDRAVRQAGLTPNIFLQKEDVSDVKTETVIYLQSPYSDLLLDVWRVDDGKTEKPVVIYIHGGGWIQSDRTAHSYYSSLWAKNGYVVFCPDYDLSTEERHLADTTELQLLEAFAWVKKHAADFGGDASRLFVAGGSAGGTLALNISYKIASGVYETSEDGTALPEVRAVSVTFPVASVEEFYRNDDLFFGRMAHKMAGWYTGCAPEDDPALYARQDPLNYVTAEATPTFIMVGKGDALVPPEPTAELDALLEKAGVDHKTLTVPFANHIFDMTDGSMLNCAYMDLTLDWFGRYQ